MRCSIPVTKDLEERFCEADASVAQACRFLEEGAAKEAVARTQQAIEKGKQLLIHRQKLIRIADRGFKQGMFSGQLYVPVYSLDEVICIKKMLDDVTDYSPSVSEPRKLEE